VGMLDGWWFESKFGSSAISANRTNTNANRWGQAGRYLGGAALASSIVYAISETVKAENRLQTGLVQTGEITGSLAGGYVGGYLIGETLVLLSATTGVVIAPYLALGITVAGSVVLASIAAEAAREYATDLYDEIEKPDNN